MLKFASLLRPKASPRHSHASEGYYQFRGATMILARVVSALMFALLFLPLSSSARQSGMNLTGSTNCNTPDFDTTVALVNGPGDYYGIVLYNRNISDHPCIFDRAGTGPGIVPDRVEGHPPFGIRYQSNGPNRIITLPPGDQVQQTFRWHTQPPAPDVECSKPKLIGNPVLLVTPSLFKQICSEIEVSSYSVVPSSGTDDKPEESPAFELTTHLSGHYMGEYFALHVAPLPGSDASPPTPDVCPTFYLRERSPNGDTRIDELHPLAFQGCGPAVLGHDMGDWISGFELDSGAKSRWEGAGQHAFQVLQLVGSADDVQLHFASSNILHIPVSDPAAIPRKWGPKAKGIATDITLDKDTFVLGEDVPLHIAVEDFDAEGTVYAWDPLWDPCMVIGIEVWNAHGPVQADERFPNWSICTGHGFGPRPYAKSKVIPLERSLGAEGWLPNHPGTYTIIVSWGPCISTRKPVEDGSIPPDLKPLALARATATIHIVPKSSREGE